MAEAIDAFRGHIIESGYVLDPEGTHHEFVSGMHGQKLDFDNLEDEDPLYAEWINVAGDYIKSEFPDLPTLIIGVAKGTNRVALDVAPTIGGGRVIGLESAKDKQDSKRLYLPVNVRNLVKLLVPELVVVLEDVGTTGSNSVQVAVQTRDAGAKRVEVVSTWKRRAQLERLEEAGIPNRAIIDEELATYSPEDCVKTGFCSKGWDFIPRAA